MNMYLFELKSMRKSTIIWTFVVSNCCTNFIQISTNQMKYRYNKKFPQNTCLREQIIALYPLYQRFTTYVAIHL